jgi:molybdopterin/thiamine biosynthesis adenylyltransferase
MDVRVPTTSQASPDAARLRSGTNTSQRTRLTRRPKEVSSHARKEEAGGQAQDERTPEARHRRRTQERLAALVSPWWERDPAALDREVRALKRAGFHPRRAARQTDKLVLLVVHDGTTYELDYDDDFASGGAVTAFALMSSGGVERGQVVFNRSAPSASLSALRAVMGPQAQAARTAGVVLIPRGSDQGARGGSHGRLLLGAADAGPCIALTGITGTTDAETLTANASPLTDLFPHPIAGLWARVPEPPGPAASHEAEVRLVEQVLARAHGLTPGRIRTRLCREVGALLSGNAYQRWTFVRRSASGEPQLLRTEWLNGAPAVSARAPYALELRSASVTIVGCGAVGWSVAVLLARAGVRSFTLHDADVLYGGNLPRVGAMVPDIGGFKVDRLAMHLRQIATDVRVRASPFDVGSAVGTRGLLRDVPDLFVNLTGEDRSTLETNRAALIAKRPALFAWVSNGVVGGRIFQVRPFETACYECVRAAAPTPIRSRGLLRAGVVWEGSAIEAAAFAALVAKTAVSVLVGNARGLRVPDHAVVEFDGLGTRVKRVDITRDPHCPECGTGRGIA